MTYKFPFVLAAMLLIVALGACSQSTEVPTHGENYTDTREEPTDEAVPTNHVKRAHDPEPTPAADTNMTASLPDKAASPAPVPDEQLMDDASATGMTARTSRDDQTNQAAPTEPGEVK